MTESWEFWRGAGCAAVVGAFAVWQACAYWQRKIERVAAELRLTHKMLGNCRARLFERTPYGKAMAAMYEAAGILTLRSGEQAPARDLVPWDTVRVALIDDGAPSPYVGPYDWQREEA
jgi:hypothetical protein